MNQPMPPQQPYYVPQQPPPKSKTWLWVLLAVFGVIFLMFVGCAALVGGAAKSVSDASSSATWGSGPKYPSYNTTPTTAAKQQQAVSTPAPGTIPAGEWLVPSEVQPGLYRSAGPDEGFVTYCQVTTEDKNGHVLEWKNSGQVGQNVVIRVSPNAATVNNSSCATFVKIG